MYLLGKRFLLHYTRGRRTLHVIQRPPPPLGIVEPAASGGYCQLEPILARFDARPRKETPEYRGSQRSGTHPFSPILAPASETLPSL